MLEAAYRLMQERPDLSLGVVAMNADQRELLFQMFEDLKASEPAVRAYVERWEGEVESFFVKNLENVQGDERDVVFFSTGFSPTVDGTLPLNFGPLNRSGGERRLNVAITRARRQVVVFSSFDPEQLRGAADAGERVLHLVGQHRRHGGSAARRPEEVLLPAEHPRRGPLVAGHLDDARAGPRLLTLPVSRARRAAAGAAGGEGRGRGGLADRRGARRGVTRRRPPSPRSVLPHRAP